MPSLAFDDALHKCIVNIKISPARTIPIPVDRTCPLSVTEGEEMEKFVERASGAVQ